MPYLLILLYFLGLLSPFIALGIGDFHSNRPFIMEIGRAFGLIGFMILMLQVVSAGRFKPVTRPFGLDIVLRYHRHMAVVGFVFLAAHPFFMAWGAGEWGLIFSLDLPWNIWLGKGCLVLILVNVLAGMYQRKLKIKYERWRLAHDIIGPVILVGVFIHTLTVGGDLYLGSMRVWCFAALAVSLLLFAYHRLVRPGLLWRRPYAVAEVKPEAGDVWTIKMTPPEGEQTYDYLPGQFHFLTFNSQAGLPREEHHFTISSSPAEKNFTTSTIKALGDFTSRAGLIRPGDKVRIHGPFGRFSHLVHPEEKELVFVTGGIGITPLMSMLRHMRDTGGDLPVTLFYANVTDTGIVFKDELDEIVSGGYPRLNIVHILERPPQGWTGESGLLSKDLMERHLTGPVTGKGFYLCGPVGLVQAAGNILRKMGVPDRRLHTEIFSFLD